MSEVLKKLAATLGERKSADPDASEGAALPQPGWNNIRDKIGDEATEVILAAKDMQDGQCRAELVGEVSDLWVHCMVMLSHLDLEIGEVTDCLRARFGTSGIEEKARRSTGS